MTKIIFDEFKDRISSKIYERSIVEYGQSLLCMTNDCGKKSLLVLSPDPEVLNLFDGVSEDFGHQSYQLKTCDTTPLNAAALRKMLSYLNPKTLGLKKSAGCGDRLGLATAGHVRAIKQSSMMPILAQQSVRENTRTGRTPRQVIDEAMWGVFQEGWRDGYGADADHLKTTDDIDSFAEAGFTFFTIDSGDYVDGSADVVEISELKLKLESLPWPDLETSWKDTLQRFSKVIDLGEAKITITEEKLMRAAVKYGRVISNTAHMYRHLHKVMKGGAFELEMSIDETDTETSVAEHLYIATEINRLGVKLISLAPRFAGSFEKGVDYIGSLKEFEESFKLHAAIAKRLGPYKLSLHSGSDKFSIYPIASKYAGELVHLKTAGTSYLEALRAISHINPKLFRNIVAFAVERYPTDRATYHVSAKIDKMPAYTDLPDDSLTDLMEDFHAREILHVTFGSVLHNPAFREAFFDSLQKNEEVYYEFLEKHFNRHFESF